MLISNLDLLATAPGGVARLREWILTLAVQGKLVPQDPSDEPASELLKKIRAEKDLLIAEGNIKRDKPLAVIAEEEKPFELPTGWEWARLPEITYNLGQGAPTEAFTYIDVAAIDNEKGLVTDAVEVVEVADAPSRARKNIAMGTVLYSTVRPYLKNIAIVEKDYLPRAIASTAFAIMHPHVGLSSKYLLHYLRCGVFTDFVSSKAVGVAYPAINDANFFEGVIAVPPTKEQSRIVTRVEELMRLCDALEAKGQLEATQHAQLVSTLLGTLTESETPEELAENWQRIATHFDLLLDRPEAVDALEQTILQLAVRGLLAPQDPQDEPASALLKRIRLERDRLIAEGKIKRDKPLPLISEDEHPYALPPGWEWVRLGAVSEFTNGFAFPSAEFTSDKSGIGVVKIGDILHGVVTVAGMSYVTQQYASSVDTSFQVNPGDMLIAMSGATTGKLGYNLQSQIFLLNQRVGKITLHLVHQDFAFQYLTTKIAENLSISAGSAIPNLSTGQIKEITFPLPPLAEQSRIVARVTELRRHCADLRQRLTYARDFQAQFAQSLVEQQCTATI